MKNILRFSYALLIPVVLLLAACGSKEKAPDVSNIKVSLRTARFDKDLYAIDTNHIGAGLQQLSAKYPWFLNFYLDTILGYGVHGNYSDTVEGIRIGLHELLTHKDYVNLEDTIQHYYPDTKDAEAALTKGFQYMKYYFPNFNVPQVLFVNLILDRKLPAFTIDTSVLGVCLDMFLGPQFPPYVAVGVPAYLAPHLRQNYMPVAAFGVIYNNMHPFTPEDRTLLDMMIQRGKQQYFLPHILPDAPDSVLFGFTARQTEWCQKNEAVIYNFFIHQNLLYNKEPNSTMPFINDGPFAQGLEPVTDTIKVTPGNIGSWLGYKIVSAYMAEHPKVTLPELLMQQTDPAKMLEEARYRPKDNN